MRDFDQCRVIQNHRDFNLDYSRNWCDAFALHHLCRVFDPRSVLEIGYCQGFSFGLMFDSCSDHTRFTSCDITYGHDILCNMIETAPRASFFETDSLEFYPDGKFDFVLIDGAHDYQHVQHELLAISSQLTENAMVIMDDFDCVEYPEVGIAIKDSIGQTDLVPVLAGHQQIVLSRNALTEQQLDLLSAATSPFLNWTVRDWHIYQQIPSYQIKFAKLLDNFLETYQTWITKNQQC